MTLIQADALYLPYPSNYFHAIVTSPPYWGLRKYAGEQGRAWGGDPDCEHEWGDEIPNPKSSWKPGATAKVGNTLKSAEFAPQNHGQFCQKCNAWYGGLGLEPTPELHIQNMVEIFREVWRVLRPDGCVWLNYGDCFAGSGGGHKDGTGQSGVGAVGWEDRKGCMPPRNVDLQQGNLMLMPHRLAIALQQDGWIVRNDLVWRKPNPMPESVSGWTWQKHRIKTKKSKHATEHNIKGGTEAMLRDASIHQGISEDWLPDYIDCPGCEKCKTNDGYILKKGSFRHTRQHEFVFMLTKKMQYFCNQEAVREGLADSSIERIEYGWNLDPDHPQWDPTKDTDRMGERYAPSAGRNPRSVLDVPTQSYRGAHYATFPEKLIAPLIRASVPRRCCPECGMAWAPVVEKGELRRTATSGSLGNKRNEDDEVGFSNDGFVSGHSYDNTVTDYRPCCECGHEEHEPGIVLDPFGGSGTTGAVAKQLLRRWVVMDISRPYLDEQAKIRTGSGTPSKALEGLPLFEETE